MNKSVDEIAAAVQGRVVGDGTVRITGLNGIREARDGELTFLANTRLSPFLKDTGAAAILVPPDFEKVDRPLIQVENPYRAFAAVLAEYQREVLQHPSGIHPGAFIDSSVTLGDGVGIDAGVRIAPDCRIADGVVLYGGVYVGRGSTIGKDTIIYPNTTIRERVTIGQRCIIHSNVAIGSDGFGYVQEDGIRRKIPQVGTVIIGDDVEIGSNSSVDRATCGETVIGNGTKIDNLVQIGHNVRFGEHCAVSGNSGVAGSAVIGNNVTIGGMAGINGHIEIGDNVIIGGRSGVTASVESNRVVSGFPACDHRLAKRIVVGQQAIPDSLRRIRILEERIKELEEIVNGQAADHR